MPQRHISVAVLLVRRALCRLLLSVLPARRHAVVQGCPDNGGGSVEVVRALVRRDRVHRLLADTDHPGPSCVAGELRDGPRPEGADLSSSDVSSVRVDVLVLDRPVGSHVPDRLLDRLDDFQCDRGRPVLSSRDGAGQGAGQDQPDAGA